MLWAKLYENWCYHPKAVQAGDAACGAWSRLLAYTAKTMQAEIPGNEALLLAWSKQDNLDKLVEVDLLSVSRFGYRLNDWSDWQADLVGITSKKEARHNRAVKAANARWNKADDAQAMQQAPQASASIGLASASMSQASVEHVNKMAQHPVTKGESSRFQNQQIEKEKETRDRSRSSSQVAGVPSNDLKPGSDTTSKSNQGTTSRLREVYDLWYSKRPTTKDGKTFKEDFERTFLPTWSKQSIDLEVFVERVCWRLDEFDKDDSDDKRRWLGGLGTFLSKGTWQDQQPPVAPPTPKTYEPPKPDVIADLGEAW